jgi:NitT/TauT family transport system ATP-binding protein
MMLCIVHDNLLACNGLQWQYDVLPEGYPRKGAATIALPMVDSSSLTPDVVNRTTPVIELRNVTKLFRTPSGQTYTALRNLTLSVAPGEFCAVIGPTGCGKSTTLGLISSLERPSAGEVLVMGKAVQGIDPRIGYVFQTDAVFPWKNVLRNVATGPLFRGVRKAEAFELARDWIARVGLAGFEDHYPHQLSGGMRKRVALAQTFINEPQILLMDEPFSALDVQTRTLMEDELLQLWSATSASVVFVTHDLEEAISLADKVYVITAGPGTVKSLYTVDLPRPRHVAEIRFNPRFIELYHTIWEDLRNEVVISYERSKQHHR